MNKYNMGNERLFFSYSMDNDRLLSPVSHLSVTKKGSFKNPVKLGTSSFFSKKVRRILRKKKREWTINSALYIIAVLSIHYAFYA